MAQAIVPDAELLAYVGWEADTYRDKSIQLTAETPWITRSEIGNRLGIYQAEHLSKRLGKRFLRYGAFCN